MISHIRARAFNVCACCVAKHFLTPLMALNFFTLKSNHPVYKMASQSKFNIKLTFGYVLQTCGCTTFCVSFSVSPANLIPENTEGRGVGKTNNLVSPQTFMRYKNFVVNFTTYIGFHTRRAVMRARSILGTILCIDLTAFLCGSRLKNVLSASATQAHEPARAVRASNPLGPAHGLGWRFLVALCAAVLLRILFRRVLRRAAFVAAWYMERVWGNRVTGFPTGKSKNNQ